MKKILKILFISFFISLFFYTLVEARAGGGGSGGNGGGDAIGGIIALLIYSVYEIRRRKMIKKAKKDLKKALQKDSSWNLEELKEVTRNVFIKYQKARSEKNLSMVKDLMTESYYQKAKKILDIQLNPNKNLIEKFKYKDLSGYKNILENIQIHDLTLMSVRDYEGKDGDMFAMEISASMIDYIIDEKTGKFISSTLKRNKYESQSAYEQRAKTEAEPFKEYYIFIRSNGKWLLNNVKQKFSIVSDIIGLKESEIRKILEKEKNTDYINDDVFYKD